MVKIVFKRAMVFGIILLFIFACVTSSLSVQIDFQLKEYEKQDFRNLNNDYLYGYWKFDKGVGDILYDYSGNDFNGVINGATWTSGYLNNSLSFDGENDFVSLDDYSKILGFNKTDDLIIFLAFKSTTIEKGVIYGMSLGSDYNPGFHISLNFDGRIEVRLWRLNCGFMIVTEGTYNDGDWHVVEVYYNGWTGKPTINIFVDGELDTTQTYWICDFVSNDFARNKIGKNSYNSTWYYDGLVDELKVYKYPGGNEQNPPEVSGPNEGIPFEELEFTFVTHDPEDDDVELYIDWDDGSDSGWLGPYESGEEVVVSHKWMTSGNFTVKSKSMDIWDDSYWSKAHSVLIGNQAPEAPIISGPISVDLGVESEYSFVSTDYESEDLLYYVDWGDESNTGWFGPFDSGQEIKISHAWMLKDDTTIRAKSKDINDAESPSSFHDLRVGNEPPEKPIITGENNGGVDKEYECTILSTDPEGDNIYYDVLWDDGTNLTNFGPYASGIEVRLTHIWNQEGTYTIKARACDRFGKCSEWAEFEISMPKNKNINFNMNLIMFLSKHFPNIFPIFRYLSNLI
jgi:hypothetical protein